jgi:hypothetical protein
MARYACALGDLDRHTDNKHHLRDKHYVFNKLIELDINRKHHNIKLNLDDYEQLNQFIHNEFEFKQHNSKHDRDNHICPFTRSGLPTRSDHNRASTRRRSSHPQKAFAFASKVSQVLARTNARKINISVTLDPDLLGAIERLARREGVTVSAVLREMLRAEMKRRRAIRGGGRGRRRSRSSNIQGGHA